MTTLEILHKLQKEIRELRIINAELLEVAKITLETFNSIPGYQNSAITEFLEQVIAKAEGKS